MVRACHDNTGSTGYKTFTGILTEFEIQCRTSNTHVIFCQKDLKFCEHDLKTCELIKNQVNII